MSNRKPLYAMMKDYAPMIQVRYDSLITYPRSVSSLIGSYSLNSKQRQLLVQRLHSKSTTTDSVNGTAESQTGSVVNYTGLVSAAVAKRIFKKVDLLLQISPTQTVYNRITEKSQSFKLVFITLTISSAYKDTSHRIIQKECLRPLLLWLKRKKGVKSYLWKAELTKAGTIHYHLVTNRFIEYHELKNEWNKYLDGQGLLDRQYRLTGAKDANSTDIRAAKSSKAVRSYVKKYLSKSNKDSQPITGKTWDCSVNLKRNSQFTDFLSSESYDRLELAKKNGVVKTLDSEFSTIFVVAPFMINYYLSDDQQAKYREHITHVTTDFKVKQKTQQAQTVPQRTQNSNRLSAALKFNPQCKLALKISQRSEFKNQKPLKS